MRRGALLLLAVSIAVPGWSATAADDENLPNLAARPSPYVESALTWAPGAGPLGLYLHPPGPPRLLRLTAKAVNTGPYPLELHGVPTANALALDAGQCVRWTGVVCTGTVPVGTMEWHDDHKHWHFNDFAVYELRRLNADGTPDLSSAGLVGSSQKASFCLMDTDEEQQDDDGQAVARYWTCSGLLQGISPGWYDEYDSSLPGQEIPIEGVPDGRYMLVITVDPDDKLRESDETDNQSWTLVEISDNGAQAHVVS